MVAVIGASIAIMSAFFLLGEGLREEYHVPSRGDRERYDLDLTDERVVWLEAGGKVLWAPLGPTKRLPLTLETRNASLEYPVLAEGPLVAWTETSGVVRVHDFARNATVTVGDLEQSDALVLPGRTLDGRTLVVSGRLAGTGGLFAVSIAENLSYTITPVPQGRPEARTAEIVLAAGRVVWAEGSDVRILPLTGGEVRSFTANGTVVNLTADGDLVAWAEQHGNFRRVVVANLSDGSQREASAFGADQYQPALNGTRLLFVQRDGLVRLVDLVSGAERVLPARNQENVHLRLGTSWAAWLSGTIEGHNVFTVPV
ncbi:MAG TPA: hypothetical protein VNB23_09830 [Ramlibacter sp.]|nr:hypothetical protein [Ramlibacter sp.]